MRTPALASRLGAEFLGTFWLVLGGCGSAIFAARFLADDKDTGLGIGFVGVALAFGLTVLTMAYAVGHVSGGHFNPAVTIGCATARRFPWKDVPAYVATQVVAGLAAGAVLLLAELARLVARRGLDQLLLGGGELGAAVVGGEPQPVTLGRGDAAFHVGEGLRIHLVILAGGQRHHRRPGEHERHVARALGPARRRVGGDRLQDDVAPCGGGEGGRGGAGGASGGVRPGALLRETRSVTSPSQPTSTRHDATLTPCHG